jgi:hypothetical protein
VVAAGPSAVAVASLPPSRRPPLPLRVGDVEVILLGEDVDLLEDAIESLRLAIEGSRSRSGPEPMDGDVTSEVLAELAALRRLLDAPAPGLRDPALEPSPAQRRLLRQALAELSGYQRIDLPPALRELRSNLVRQ